MRAGPSSGSGGWAEQRPRSRRGRFHLGVRWWRVSGTWLCGLWGVVFLLLPALSGVLIEDRFDGRSFGLGLAFGLLLALAAWGLVLGGILGWFALVGLAPGLDGRWLALMAYALGIAATVVVAWSATAPVLMLAALFLVGFLSPRLHVKDLRRGALSAP